MHPSSLSRGRAQEN